MACRRSGVHRAWYMTHKLNAIVSIYDYELFIPYAINTQ